MAESEHGLMGLGLKVLSWLPEERIGGPHSLPQPETERSSQPIDRSQHGAVHDTVGRSLAYQSRLPGQRSSVGFSKGTVPCLVTGRTALPLGEWR